MSKELTPLEALENIEKEIEDYEGFDEKTYYQMDRTRFVIIKKALKDKERLATNLDTLREEANALYDKTKKQDEILKIIKEKRVAKYPLELSETVDKYNKFPSKDEWKLTQEEFDFLKEVL